MCVHMYDGLVRHGAYRRKTSTDPSAWQKARHWSSCCTIRCVFERACTVVGSSRPEIRNNPACKIAAHGNDGNNSSIKIVRTVFRRFLQHSYSRCLWTCGETFECLARLAVVISVCISKDMERISGCSYKCCSSQFPSIPFQLVSRKVSVEALGAPHWL